MKIFRNTFIGLLLTAIVTYLSLSPSGMLLAILLILCIFFYDRTLGLISLFSIALFNSFFINAKTQRMENYFLNFIKFSIDAESIDRNNVIMIVVPLIAFIFLFYVLLKTNYKKAKLLNSSIVFIILFSSLQFMFLFVQGNPAIIIVRYLLFFSTFVLYYICTNIKNSKKLLSYTFISIGILQIFIVFLGSFEFIFFSVRTYNGDLIVGTTATSTLFSYLMSVFLLYLFIMNPKKIFIISLTLFTFVLAQSGLQFLVFLIVLIFALKLKYSKSFGSNLVFYSFATVLLLLVSIIVNILPNYLETQAHQINYAQYRASEFIEYGFKYNYKINLVIEFFQNHNLKDILFGTGYNSLRENIIEGTAHGAIQARSLVTTPNTLFNNLLYDLGLIRLLVFYSGFILMLIYFYRQYKQTKFLEYLFLTSVMLLLFALSFLMENLNHPFVAFISGAVVGVTLKSTELKYNRNTP